MKPTNEYGVAFVGTDETIMTPTNYKNITSEMYPYVKQYQSYISNGDVTKATNILLEHPELSKMIIDANAINKIVEEIRNTQIYSMKAGQYTYIQNSEPDNPNNQDIWIGKD